MNISIKKYVKAILNIGIALVICAGVIWLLPRVLLFFLPFLIGWLIACIAGPMVKFFEEKLKIKRKAGSAVVIILVIGLVILVLYLVLGKLGREIAGFITDLPHLWGSLEEDFNNIGQNMNLILNKLPQDIQGTLNTAIDAIGAGFSGMVMDMISKISSPTIEAVGNFAKQLPAVVIGLIMCLLSSYFFVAERGTWYLTVKKIVPDSLVYRWHIIKVSMVKAVGGYFKAQLKIEIWIYLLLVIGLAILQVEYVLLIAFGIALLDFFPFFGTGTVMVPWAIVKFLNGDYKMTIGLLIIWGVGQLVRQVIQPKIVGDSMGMPPLPTLVLLYIGYRLAGVIGMIVAVPIGIIVMTMYQEGVFDTTKNSIHILSAGLNRFRTLTPQDMETVNSYQKECEEEKKKREKRKNGKL